jgi:undecaprenyl phosphate-alpha-L-ara4N flippase subunit ArnE
MKGILLTFVCVAGIACGQLLFKKGALALDADAGVAAMLLNPWVLAALAIYGAATLLWIHVLRSTPLTLAYPLFALTFVIVPLLSSAWLKEPLNASSLIGAAIILAGVVISVQGSSQG